MPTQTLNLKVTLEKNEDYYQCNLVIMEIHMPYLINVKKLSCEEGKQVKVIIDDQFQGLAPGTINYHVNNQQIILLLEITFTSLKQFQYFIVQITRKSAAGTNNTFQNIFAQVAINGLKEFQNDPDDQIVENISKFLIDKIDKDEDYFKRAAAASALGKFLLSKDKKWDKDVFENTYQLMKNK